VYGQVSLAALHPPEGLARGVFEGGIVHVHEHGKTRGVGDASEGQEGVFFQQDVRGRVLDAVIAPNA
jgi:hypothetical protein